MVYPKVETTRTARLKKHIKFDLEMKSCTIDETLFSKYENGKLIGVCATYIDNTLHTENKTYCQIGTKTRKRIIFKNRISEDIVFAALQIQINAQCTMVHQNQYLQRIKPLCLKWSFSDFRF